MTAEEVVRRWWNDTCRKLDLRDPEDREPALADLIEKIEIYVAQRNGMTAESR